MSRAMLAAATPGTTLAAAADAAEVAQLPELAAPAPGTLSAAPTTTTSSAAAAGAVAAQAPSVAAATATTTSGAAAFSPGELRDPSSFSLP